MELWVRSQDKTTLIKCSEIYIAEEKSYLIREASSSHILGAYKTIDRALEVLDEIQKSITINETINGNYEEQDKSIKALFLKYQTRIYQMPKE